MVEVSSSNLKDLIDYELGSRSPYSKIATNIMNSSAFLWSLFQLIIASPLLFWLAINLGISDLVLNDFKSRSVHLAFAVFLSFLSFPAFNSSPHKKIPFFDCLFSILAAASVLYVFFFYEHISYRIAIPNKLDLYFSLIGITLLLECARRTIGKAVVILSIIFLLYAYFGQWMPGVIAHKGWGLSSIASHLWLSSEGVFGIALGVSSEFVFLYVLFGSLLDKAGAGNFFIKLSFSLLGRFTGGPAKAAVVASGFMGMISGSSIANTITIGTFTIPLMKKMGLSSEKAAAIEVSAGVNGQIMPPVMGAAAFLISEFLSIPYIEIIKHAFIPAIIIYITLLYIVHLESCKLGESNFTTVITKPKSIYYSILIFLLSICCLCIACGFIYILIEGANIYGFHVLGIKAIFHEKSIYIIGLLLILIYLLTIYFQFKNKKTTVSELDDNVIPNLWETVRGGLHYFIPIAVLIWTLVVERLSSASACFCTITFLIFMLLTYDAVGSIFENHSFFKIKKSFNHGIKKVYEAMIASSKNMLSIAVATGVAGIIVGTVSLTGFGLSIGGLVDMISSGNLFITLILTAIMCIILGMGMPTTACYIIVSTLMVPVLDKAIYENGLHIHPLAVHLFVFYFGLMADVTPPVGIASYAASAIAHGNAFKTSVQAFLYNIRTMIVPFVFVFNNGMILLNVKSFWHSVITILACLIGVLSISAGMQGYFIRRSKFYESMLLILSGFMFVSSQYVYSLIIDPCINVPLSEYNKVFTIPESAKMTIMLKDSSSSLNDNNIKKITVPIPITHNKQLNDIIYKNFAIKLGKYHKDTDLLDIESMENNQHINYLPFKNNHKIVKIEIYINKVKYIYYLLPSIIIIMVIFLQLRTKKSYT